jgi:hypothetical protein
MEPARTIRSSAPLARAIVRMSDEGARQLVGPPRHDADLAQRRGAEPGGEGDPGRDPAGADGHRAALYHFELNASMTGARFSRG